MSDFVDIGSSGDAPESGFNFELQPTLEDLPQPASPSSSYSVPWDANQLDALLHHVNNNGGSDEEIMAQLLDVHMRDPVWERLRKADAVSVLTIPHLRTGSPQYLHLGLKKLDLLRLLYSHVQNRADTVLAQMCQIESTLPDAVDQSVQPQTATATGATKNPALNKINALKALATTTANATKQHRTFHEAKEALENLSDLFESHVARGARHVVQALVRDVASFFGEEGGRVNPDLKEGVSAPLETVDVAFRATAAVLHEKFESCIVAAQAMHSGLRTDMADFGLRLCQLSDNKRVELERADARRRSIDEFDPTMERLPGEIELLKRDLDILHSQVTTLVNIDKSFEGEPLLSQADRTRFQTSIDRMEHTLASSRPPSQPPSQPLSQQSSQRSQPAPVSARTSIIRPALGVRRPRDEEEYTRPSRSSTRAPFDAPPITNTYPQIANYPHVGPRDGAESLASSSQPSSPGGSTSNPTQANTGRNWFTTVSRFLVGGSDSEEDPDTAPPAPTRGQRTE